MQAHRTCSYPGCDEAHKARGWCNAHYLRWRKQGDPSVVKIIVGDDEARFWSKVDKAGPLAAYAPHLGRCWLWTGNTSSEGYGRFPTTAKNGAAHRFAYELLVGPIPEGLTLDHLCRVRNRVRPSHLEAVTVRENSLRGETFQARNAAKTHCPKGHPYDEKNTRWTKRAKSEGVYFRVCRNCLNAARRRRRSGTGYTATITTDASRGVKG